MPDDLATLLATVLVAVGGPAVYLWRTDRRAAKAERETQRQAALEVREVEVPVNGGCYPTGSRFHPASPYGSGSAAPTTGSRGGTTWSSPMEGSVRIVEKPRWGAGAASTMNPCADIRWLDPRAQSVLRRIRRELA